MNKLYMRTEGLPKQGRSCVTYNVSNKLGSRLRTEGLPKVGHALHITFLTN